jgi:transposase
MRIRTTLRELTSKNESLAEAVSSSKEKNDDKRGKEGTVHARVQADADQEGKVASAGAKPVSQEEMGLAQLRAKVTHLKMERDILKKCAAYFAKELI